MKYKYVKFEKNHAHYDITTLSREFVLGQLSYDNVLSSWMLNLDIGEDLNSNEVLEIANFMKSLNE